MTAFCQHLESVFGQTFKRQAGKTGQQTAFNVLPRPLTMSLTEN